MAILIFYIMQFNYLIIFVTVVKPAVETLCDYPPPSPPPPQKKKYVNVGSCQSISKWRGRTFFTG